MEIEIGRLLRAIRRFWWIPVLGMLLFGLVGGASNRITSSTYTTTTRMLIVPDTLSGESVIGGSPTMLIDIARSTPVLEQTIEDLSLDVTVEELRGDVQVVLQEGTHIILVSVTSEDPELAANISNSIAEQTDVRSSEITLAELEGKRDELQSRSNELRDQLLSIDARITDLEESETDDEAQRDAELASLREERFAVAQEKADIDNSLRVIRSQISRSYSDVSVIEAATPPENPDGLPTVIRVIVGVFVGGLVGAALILFMAVRDKTVVNGAQVARITGAPILREIGRKSFSQDIQMVMHFISGLRSVDPTANRPISIVAPTELSQLDNEALSKKELVSELGVSGDFAIANGAMAHEVALASALQSSGVVVASKIGVTDESDLRKTVDSLQVAGVAIIGSIVFK